MNNRSKAKDRIFTIISKREDQRNVKRDRGGYLNKEDYNRFFWEWWNAHISVFPISKQFDVR